MLGPVIALSWNHSTHASGGVCAITVPPGYTMHMGIHHCLSSADTPIHAHIEPIAHALVYHDPAQAIGLSQAMADVFVRIGPWHEQPMACGHRKRISIDLDPIEVEAQIFPKGYALLLCLSEIHLSHDQSVFEHDLISVGCVGDRVERQQMMAGLPSWPATYESNGFVTYLYLTVSIMQHAVTVN